MITHKNIIGASICLAIITAGFIFDLYTPLGVAVGIAYLPLIFCGSYFFGKKGILTSVTISTILTITGYFFSADIGEQYVVVEANRVLSIGILWGVAILLMLQKKMELALIDKTENMRKTSERFNSIIENSPYLISIKDHKRRYINTSKNFADFLNIKGEIIGKTDDELFSPELSQNIKNQEDEVLSLGKAIVREEKFILNDRETRYFLSSRFPLYDSPSGLHSVCTISMDIKELKIAENNLRFEIQRRKDAENSLRHETDLLHLLNKIAVSANEAQDIEEASSICIKEICSFTGWPVGHAYIYEEHSEILTPSTIWKTEKGEGFKKFQKITKETKFKRGEGLPGRVIESGKPEWILDVSKDKNFPRAKNFPEIPIKSAFAFPALAGDRVAAVLEFFTTDEIKPNEELMHVLSSIGAQIGHILARKIAEDKQLQIMKNLIHSNTELERFAYIASHDLQEPLRTISSYVQLLRENYKEKMDKDGEQFLEYVTDAALHMRNLVADLLSYSRFDTRGTTFKRTNFQEVFDYIIVNLSASIKESGTKITHGKLPVITADSTQIAQLLQNIIGNAIKYRSKDRASEIHISAVKEKGEWLFSVKDNGIGIEKKYCEQIFSIFKRLHNKKSYPGTGLGLAICRKIVENHGGRIWVESTPGVGSTFYFTLQTKKPAKKRKS